MKPTAYVLSLGEVRARFLPFPHQKLNKTLKNILWAARSNNVSRMYDWFDYGTDREEFYPILLAGVHSISKDPLGQLEEILSKANEASKKYHVQFGNGIAIYNTTKLQIEPNGFVASVGKGEPDGIGWDDDHFPATQEEISGYASKLLKSFAVHLKVSRTRLEERIASCRDRLASLNLHEYAR